MPPRTPSASMARTVRGRGTHRRAPLPARVVAGLALVAALAASAPARADDEPAADAPPPHSHGAEAAREGTRLGAELVIRSLSLLGVRYRFGGNSPDTGLDCSGLVRHVYEGALGLVLPRRSEEMSRKGESVALDQLRPGDLVFFRTLRRAFSHVGIYIGDNRFVHAPSRGGQVRVEQIDNRYWMRRFNGARRIAAADAPPDVLTSASFGRATALEPAQFPGASPSARDAISPGAAYY
ncbi:MAG: C40 family peptidase [Burkholderiaceae bacterium]|nr:C40 family peptidase [Burkholderiaceae bacterium]